VLTISSVSFFVRLDSLETSSMRSALVISLLPPREPLGLLVPEPLTGLVPLSGT
jgi:hypothetical protein